MATVQVYPSTIFLLLGYYNSFYIRANFVPSPLAGKGEDKEYPTIGARMIRLEDKVGTLLVLSLCMFCLQAEEIKWFDQLPRLLSRVWLQLGACVWGRVLESFDMIVFWLACCDQHEACTRTLCLPYQHLFRAAVRTVPFFSKPGMCRAVDFPCTLSSFLLPYVSHL